jgi:hypothetical protein
MDQQAVSPDHADDEAKAFGIARAMSKDEIAELAIGPLDYQDRHAARVGSRFPEHHRLRAWPDALWRARRLRPLGGRRDPDADIRRPAGSMWIEETYDVSANVFNPVDQRKKAPPVLALEPRTLELVRWHRRYLTRRNHPGIKTGLLFSSEAGTRSVGNDQLNDGWREVQVLAGSDRPVTVHGIRHSFHDLARQQGVPDAVVKAMAGRAGAEVAQRGQDKHLHYPLSGAATIAATVRRVSAASSPSRAEAPPSYRRSSASATPRSLLSVRVL